MERVLPLIEKINNNIDTIISIDTSSPEIMLEGAKAGAGLINDVRALQKSGAVEAVSNINLPVCLMHMKGAPATMQEAPKYKNLINEILQFLEERISVCTNSGIDRNQIIIDPGFGFGKALEHNLELLGRLSEFEKLKLPILVGLSRKAMLGLITGRSVKDRQAAGISAAVIALMQGVNIIRTHDVTETVDAVNVCDSRSRNIWVSCGNVAITQPGIGDGHCLGGAVVAEAAGAVGNLSPHDGAGTLIVLFVEGKILHPGHVRDLGYGL